MSEPGRLDVLAVPAARIAAEIHRTERAAIAEFPASVIPGSDDQVVDTLYIALLVLLVGLDRAVVILGVEPAGDVQGGHPHGRLYVWQHAAHRLAPEAIVVRMFVEGVPARRLTVKDVLVDIRQRAEVQELVVVIVAAEHIGPSEAPLHRADPAECIVESEGAVVMIIVADEHIGAGRLRGGRFQRRMRVDQGAGREKSTVRDPEGPYPAVVPGYVSDDPIDGVIGVGGLVRGFGNVLVAHRTQ